jgi:Leucine-rich repeat (LRR) protein
MLMCPVAVQVPFRTAEQGCQWLACELQSLKVLLVIDDVWHRKHLQLLNFATKPNCSHPDSTLNVTTRDERVLQDDCGCSIDGLRFTRPVLLGNENATRLLCRHAFRSQQPPAEYKAAVISMLRECKGLPLALQTLGASLVGKHVAEWEQLVQRLRAVDQTLPQFKVIMACCRPSYEALPPHLQRCFMDFAAYPEGAHVPADELVALWAARAPLMSAASIAAAELKLKQLHQRCLVSEDGDGSYHMHNVLRDIAVLEARKSCDRALAAGVAHLPEELQVRGEPDAQQSATRWLPRRMRKQITSLAGLKQVSLHSNSSASSWAGGADMPRLRVLYLQKSAAESLPAALATFSQLRVLSLARMGNLRGLPDTLKSLLMLNVLDLHGCRRLHSLPQCIGQLQQLQRRILRDCESLEVLPEVLGEVLLLRVLDLSGCDALAALPERISGLSQMERLDLRGCRRLAALPERVGDLSQLQSLDLRGCFKLAALPERVGGLSQLQRLDLSGCDALVALPECIGDLSQLQSLDLSGCRRLAALPERVGGLSQLPRLDLSGCWVLAALPERVGDLSQLQSLDLSGCWKLAALP